MNSDDVLAELDAQYRELIESVQLEGLSHDENSEISGNNKSVDVLHKGGLQNVSEIIRKYEQTLQTSREFYENEIKKLEETKRKTEAKYIESKKQIKKFDNRLNKISENHDSHIATLTEQKDAVIISLQNDLKETTDKLTELSAIHDGCSNVLLLNQETVEKLQQENDEIKIKYESSEQELLELKSQYEEQSELLSTKKSDMEKLKVELIQTRTAFDEQQKEFEDLQSQLTECRNEINFLCTTNEELYKMNEDLSEKLKKYPQSNSLLNSILFEDDENDDAHHDNDDHANHNLNVQNAEPEEEERKHNVSDHEDEHELSQIFNLNHSNITIDACPKLKTASTMYMMENIEDNKIKDEIKRLSQDANTWNHQYETVCKEKQALMQTITQYEQIIEQLQDQLIRQQSVPKEGQVTDIPVQKDIESMIKIQNEIKILKQQKVENDDTLKQFIELNEANQGEIHRLNEELKTLQLRKVQHDNNENIRAEINEKNTKIKEKDATISDMTRTLNTMQKESDRIQNEISKHCAERDALRKEIIEMKDINEKLENVLNEYQIKSKQSELSVTRVNERYEKLSQEYMQLQTEFHETKLNLNHTASKEEDYKQQIHKLSVHIKYVMKEMEQSKMEQMSLRSNNSKQTEEISQLNHDMKQMFSDLENTRVQLMQSQQLIGTLEKQFFGQNQQLQQTRESLRMQMNINMQNLGVMNNLKNSQRAMNQNEFSNHMETMNRIQNLNKNITMDSGINNVQRNPPAYYKENKPKNIMHRTVAPTTPPTKVAATSFTSRPKTAPVPDDIMNLARGKPFQSRRLSLNTNNMKMHKEQIKTLQQQRQKIEADLFKLPTKPRSLEQRKRKHSLESALHGIETQIENIRKNKGKI